jgi:hypothetical protein
LGLILSDIRKELEELARPTGTNFVDTKISNLLRDLPFSTNSSSSSFEALQPV